MCSFFPKIFCAVILVCGVFFSTPLPADSAPPDSRIPASEENIKTQNQQLNEIQKKLDTYDQNSRDFLHIYEKNNLIYGMIKNHEDKSLWYFMASIAVTTISLMIFLGLLGYGIYTYKRMNEEVEKARADAKEVEEIKGDAVKFRAEFSEAKREIEEFRKEREKFIQEDRITRSKTFAATALSLSTAWEKATDVIERERLWQQINDYYNQATKLNPKNFVAWNDWGILFSKQATLTGSWQPDLWRQAEECYQKATTIKPDYAEAWNNWGAFLNDKAKLTDNEKSRLDLRQQATDCYQKALLIKPDLAEAWFNLANRLRFSDQPQEAEKCYEKAAALDPNNDEAWRNWGTLLCDQAKKEGLDLDQKINLLEQAREKLERAVALGSDLSKALLAQCEEKITELKREKTAGVSSETGRSSTPSTASKEEGEESDQG